MTLLFFLKIPVQTLFELFLNSGFCSYSIFAKYLFHYSALIGDVISLLLRPVLKFLRSRQHFVLFLSPKWLLYLKHVLAHLFVARNHSAYYNL